MTPTGQTALLGENRVSVPFCPPQTPQGIIRDQTQELSARTHRSFPVCVGLYPPNHFPAIFNWFQGAYCISAFW